MTDQTIGSAEYPFIAIGRERFKSDRRQLGGLLLVLGTCATFQPLSTVASLMGVDGTGASTPLSRSALAAGLIQIVFGSIGMVTGYLSLVHDYGHKNLSGALIVLTQLAWMPYLIGMIEIGWEASAPYEEASRTSISNSQFIVEPFIDNPWIPRDYLPTQKDVRFFGAMGILGVFSYGFAFLGSFAFIAFALFAFDEGKPTLRDARYYRGRLLFYTCILTLAGVSQLLLGSYVLFEFGNGPLVPSVGIAMYQVHFPEISVTVGLLQMLVGYCGLARYIGWVPVGPGDHQLQMILLLQWVSMLVMQNIVQIGYSPGDAGAESAPSLALLSLGLNLLPAFLDYKMRTTPEFLTDEYYGIVADSKHGPVSEPEPPAFETLESEESFHLDSTGAPIESAAAENEGLIKASESGVNSTEPTSAVAQPLGQEQRQVPGFQDEEVADPEYPYPVSTPTDGEASDDDESERGREPTARLESRSIDRNALTNEMYRRINQSTRTEVKSNKSKDRNPDDFLEPSERRNSRRVDQNEIINQMYDDYNQSMQSAQARSDQGSHTEGSDSEPYDAPLNDTVASTEDTGRRNSHVSQLSGDSAGINSAGYSQPSAYSDARSPDGASQPSAYSDARSQPSAYSESRGDDGFSQPSAGYSQPSGYGDYHEDIRSTGGYSQPSAYSDGRSYGGYSQPSAYSEARSNGAFSQPSYAESTEGPPSATSIDTGEYTSESRHAKEDPPERMQVTSQNDDVVRGMYGRMPRDPDEAGITRYESYDTPDDLSDDSPDDSTAVLERKLDDIEKELFTDSMESFHNSLAGIL